MELLRAVADRDARAGELAVALAEAVLGDEVVELARAVLGGESRLLVRRGVALATAIVETADASEDGSSGETGDGG